MADQSPPPLHRSGSSQAKPPKGILKNAPRQDSGDGTQTHILWDENNLAYNEGQKDSTMKITEPKTPYVRYNPLTDEVEGDIPGFSLDGHITGPTVTPESPSPGPETDGNTTPRRSSISSSGRGHSGSNASSRSTSFNLPAEERASVRPSGEIVQDEVEEEMDEETAAKHAAFVKARGRHYSNEAEAMKIARALMQEDDDSSEVDGAPAPANGAVGH